MITTEQFWVMAEETRLQTEYRVDTQLNFLKSLSLDTLKQICLQYRYFTQDFPDNLAVLISKLPQGNLKSLLGEILNQELGEGNPSRSHLRLYDNFLLSLGISEDILETSVHPENDALLSELRLLTSSQPAAYGIGLVGMGGECLCQIYLANMYENLLKNPYLEANKEQIDWQFWTFHAGEADVSHRRQVRQMIDEVVSKEPKSVEYLAAGYLKAKGNWDQMWNHNFSMAMGEQFLAVS